MGKGLAGTLKLGVILGVILLAGIAVFYVTDVFASEDARDAAVKSMWVVGIFTAASLIITVVAGGGNSGESPPDSPPR